MGSMRTMSKCRMYQYDDGCGRSQTTEQGHVCMRTHKRYGKSKIPSCSVQCLAQVFQEYGKVFIVSWVSGPVLGDWILPR